MDSTKAWGLRLNLTYTDRIVYLYFKGKCTNPTDPQIIEVVDRCAKAGVLVDYTVDQTVDAAWENHNAEFLKQYLYLFEKEQRVPIGDLNRALVQASDCVEELKSIFPEAQPAAVAKTSSRWSKTK